MNTERRSLPARLAAPVAIPLAALGRQGRRALVVSVAVGIAVPPVGAVLKPYVTEAVFVLLCLAFVRMDVGLAITHLRRPALTLAAIAWTAVLVPLLTGFACRAAGVDIASVDLHTVLVLQGVASPMMAAPALAALMGLDATLVLLTLIGSSALVPFTAPAFAGYFLDSGFSLPPVELGTRLFVLLAGSAALGLAARRLAGARRVARRAAEVDGLNIVALYVFVAAVMGDVGVQALQRPVWVAALTLLGFTVFAVLFVVTSMVFAGAGRRRSLALGFMASHRNMGLMVAGVGGTLPETAWLYFAVSQLPIYLSPYLLQPLVRRLSGASPARSGSAP